MELGNGQSVGISFNCETNTTHMEFFDETFKRYCTTKMVLSGGDTRVLLQEIPNIDTAFMKILAGDWEHVERKDLTNTMKIKVTAEEMPKIRIIVKNSVFKWTKFELKYFEWAKLKNCLLPVLEKLCEELDGCEYMIPLEQQPQAYRWKLLRPCPPNSLYRAEYYAGPWQNNIHEVLNNGKEFGKRNSNEEVGREKSTMVIEVLSNDGQMIKTIGPVINTAAVSLDTVGLKQLLHKCLIFVIKDCLY